MIGSALIAVFGANGHTGRFVVEALEHLGARTVPVTRTGRFKRRDGSNHPGRVLDITKASRLDEALAGVDAAVNCAGPFFDTAQPIAAAAIRAGLPYLDVSAEQHTTRRLFEELDLAAAAAGVVVAPAMAFYGALADLLATGLVKGEDDIKTIEIAVGLDSWRPTRGTLETGNRNTFQRMVVREGRLAPAPSPPLVREWAFPGALGTQPVTTVALSEIILIAQHLKVGAVTSFMNLKPLADLVAAEGPPQAVDHRGRSGQTFTLDVRVEASGRLRRAHAVGRDIYSASASMIARATLDLAAGPARCSGVRAAGELFEPRAFLARLEPDIVVYWD